MSKDPNGKGFYFLGIILYTVLVIWFAVSYIEFSSINKYTVYQVISILLGYVIQMLFLTNGFKNIFAFSILESSINISIKIVTIVQSIIILILMASVRGLGCSTATLFLIVSFMVYSLILGALVSINTKINKDKVNDVVRRNDFLNNKPRN